MSDSTGRSGFALAGAIVGAVVVSALSGPLGPVAAGLIGGVAAAGVTAIGVAVFPNQLTEGVALEDRPLSSTAVGRVLATILGTHVAEDQIWLFRQKIEPDRKTKRSLFSKTTTITNRLTYSKAICLSVNGNTQVIKHKIGDDVVFDATNDIGPSTLFGDPNTLRYTAGELDALPFPEEEELFGLEINAYRGVTRQFAYRLPVDRYGPAPIERWWVTSNPVLRNTSLLVDEAPLFNGGSTFTETGRWFSNKREFLAFKDGTTSDEIVKWDSVTQTRLAEIDLADNLASLAVDPRNDRVFVGRGVSPTNWRIWELDPETLQAKSRSEDTYVGNSTSFIGFAGTAAEPLVIVKTNGNAYHVFNPNVVGNAVLDPIFNTTVTEFPQNFVSTEAADLGHPLSTTVSTNTVTDNAGNMWSLVAFSDETWASIVKYDADTGRAVNDYLVTNVSKAVESIGYDPETNRLYFPQDNTTLVVWDIATTSVSGTVAVSGVDDKESLAAHRNLPVNSRIWISRVSNDTISEVDLVSLSIVRTINLETEHSLPTGEWLAPLYDTMQNAVISRGGSTEQIVWCFLDKVDGGDVSVQEIVEWGAQKAGMVVGTDIDATNATERITGYRIRDSGPFAKHAVDLATLIFHSIARVGFIPTFTKRGGASQKTFDDETLGAHPHGSEPIPPFQERDLFENEAAPGGYKIEFTSSDADFETRTQATMDDSQRVVGAEAEPFTTDAALSDQFAKNWTVVAQAFFNVARKIYQVPATIANFDAEPGKGVGIEAGFGSTEVLAGHFDHGELTGEGIYDCRIQAEETEVYALTGTPAPFTGTLDHIEIPDLHKYRVFDWPHLEQGRSERALAVLAFGCTDRRFDGVTIGEGTAIEGPFGAFVDVGKSENIQKATLVGALSPKVGSIFDWDLVTTITIRNLNYGSLTSASRDDLPFTAGVLFPSNVMAVVDSNNQVEFLVVATWVDNGDGTWTGSELQRGWWNTEEYQTHASGEEVFFPTADTIFYQEIPDDWHGATRYFSASDLTFAVNDLGERSLAIISNSMKPYPVLAIEGSIDLSDNVNGTFDSQSLNQGPSGSFGHLSTGVETLSFEVVHYTDNTFTTVVADQATSTEELRVTEDATVNNSVVTIASDETTGTQSWQLTAADVTKFYGTPQSEYYVGIVQINEGIRGPERTATIS